MSEVLIVGGGIGGLSTAAMLKRLDIPARVVERTPRFESVGAGITIQANAMAVLRAFGIEFSRDDVFPMGTIEVVDLKGRTLTRGDPDEIQPDPPSVNIHHGDLDRRDAETPGHPRSCC